MGMMLTYHEGYYGDEAETQPEPVEKPKRTRKKAAAQSDED